MSSLRLDLRIHYSLHDWCLARYSSLCRWWTKYLIGGRLWTFAHHLTSTLFPFLVLVTDENSHLSTSFTIPDTCCNKTHHKRAFSIWKHDKLNYTFCEESWSWNFIIPTVSEYNEICGFIKNTENMNWVVTGRAIKGMKDLEEMKCRMDFSFLT